MDVGPLRAALLEKEEVSLHLLGVDQGLAVSDRARKLDALPTSLGETRGLGTPVSENVPVAFEHA